MTNSVEVLLKDVIDKVESRLSDLQDQVDQSVAALAGYVGPAAAAHRLAELSLAYAKLAKLGLIPSTKDNSI